METLIGFRFKRLWIVIDKALEIDCYPDRQDLNGKYTVFGHVVAGNDVPERIQRGDLITRMYVRE